MQGSATWIPHALKDQCCSTESAALPEQLLFMLLPIMVGDLLSVTSFSISHILHTPALAWSQVQLLVIVTVQFRPGVGDDRNRHILIESFKWIFSQLSARSCMLTVQSDALWNRFLLMCVSFYLYCTSFPSQMITITISSWTGIEASPSMYLIFGLSHHSFSFKMGT